MPFSVTHDIKTSAATITGTGMISHEERLAALAELLCIIDENTIKFVLFDLTGMAAENDPSGALDISGPLIESMDRFKGKRIAVVMPDTYLTPASVVMKFQEHGITVVDFRSLHEAEEWLYRDQTK